MQYDLLINKDNLLDSSYIPSDLVETDDNKNNFHNYINPLQRPQISSYVLHYFKLMQQDAKENGFYIIIDSGYRSYKYQKDIWDYYVKKDGIDDTKKKVAMPGSSEHQSGLAFDIAYFKNNVYSDDIKDSDEEIKWLKNNAYKYGFILRYPIGKENITGYKYEPWHYRFVGKDVAKICYNNNLTLEEYHLLKDNKKGCNIMNKNILNFLDEYIDKLLSYQSTARSWEQKNIFTRNDYYRVLLPVIKMVLANKDCSLLELRQKLLVESSLDHVVNMLVNDFNMVPGIGISYGTDYFEQDIISGYKDYRQDESLTKEHLFDLASVSKMFTCIAVLKLVEMGELNLNDQVSKIDPRFVNLDGVTIDDLLSFQVKLTSDGRIDEADNKIEAEKRIFNMQKERIFMKSPYTDMGAIILRFIVEKVSGLSLYDFLKTYVLDPLELNQTVTNIPQDKINLVSSTDNGFIASNNKIIKVNTSIGSVHDKKAHILGQNDGIFAGHAGLFSSLDDLNTFTKFLSGNIKSNVLSRDTINHIADNRTGSIYYNYYKKYYTKYFGQLCYSKHPLKAYNEVPHYYSGMAGVMSGFTGCHICWDPLYKTNFSLVANRIGNRVYSYDKTFKDSVYHDNKGGKRLKFCDNDYIVSNNFTNTRSRYISEVVAKLLLQYRFLEDLAISYGEKLEYEEYTLKL